MGAAYPELIEHARTTDMWLAAEEEGFGRTLAQGTARLHEEIERTRSQGRTAVPAEFVFVLYDTHGFPPEMTRELLAEAGLSVEGDFDALMEEQRVRSRAGAARISAGASPGASALDALGDTPPTRFTGYETEQQHTTVLAVEPAGDGAAQAAGGERRLVKLAESPFYLAGGGQVSDVGVIECEHGDCRARVEDVLAVGPGPGAEGPRRAGRAAPRRAGPRPGRPRPAPRDRGQPHGHPPAPRRPARAAGQPCAPGRLLRRSRQAPIRLQPWPRAERRGAPRRGGPGQRVDRPQRPRPPDRNDPRGGQAARCDGAVRREVRRCRADGRDRRRGLLARALWGHPRALDRGDRRLPHPQRDLQRRERPTHRGAHRAAGGRAPAHARPTPAGCRGRAAHDARAGSRGRPHTAREAQAARKGGPGGLGRRGSRRSTSTRSPAAPPSSTAPAC